MTLDQAEQRLQRQTSWAHHLLEELARRIPKSVQLQQLEVADNELSMIGIGASDVAIAEFLSALQQSGFFERVYLLSVGQATLQNVRVKKFAATAKHGVAGLKAEDLSSVGYVYEPSGKRDLDQIFVNKEEPEQMAQLPPLQRYKLNQFQLVAIILADEESESVAAIVSPAGTEHILRVGDYIGQHWGQVSAIHSDHIEVREEYQTVDGDLMVIKKTLSMSGE